MAHKPEKNRENQLTNQYVDPNRGMKQERPNVLVPNPQGDGASIEHREGTLLSTGPTSKHLKDARAALERPSRVGGQPKAEHILKGMHDAIEAMLKYLEELDQKNSR
jgi:hypothetical protein